MDFLKINNRLKKPDIQFFVNFAVALYVNAAVINLIFSAAIPLLKGTAMAFIYATTSLLLVMFFFFNKITISMQHYFLFVVITIWYLFSRYVLSVSDLTELFFLIFFVIPFLFCSTLKIDIDVVVKLVLIFSFGGIFFLDKIFVLNELLSSINMGTSYAFLTPIVASVAYFVIPKKKNIFFTVLACSNVVYLVELFLHGSRGTLVCFLCACSLFFVFSKYETKRNLKRLSFFCLIFLFGYVFFWDIVEMMSSVLTSFGIRVRIIEKLLQLHITDNLLNGRDYIYQISIDTIKEKIFWGHGISSFDYYTHLEYPHNLFLQLLFDMGIVGSMLIILPVLKGMKTVFLGSDKSNIIWGVFLFSVSIPRSLFSGNIWEIPLLWFTFGYFINNMDLQSERQYESSYKKL